MKIIKKIKLQFSRNKSKAKVLTKINKSDKLILFFVPAEVNVIGGGVLSICTIFKEIENLKSLHNSNVLACFLPSVNQKEYTYTKFDNEMFIFNFSEIVKMFPKLDFLEIHLPDYMIPFFNKSNNKISSFIKWIDTLRHVKINILNQNDLLMPKLEFVNGLRFFTSDITMTVAHEKYATKERSIYYNMPLHLFSPWLTPTPYLYKSFENKNDIIVLSPDDMDRVPSKTNVSKDSIIKKMRKELPNYDFVEVNNMTYNNYKKLVSDAKFTLTFGEGLDGYFIETIFSGGISFAVYNEIFFKPDFKDLPTLYDSYDDLIDKIVSDIKRMDNSINYQENHKILFEKVNKIYSKERLIKNIENYYLGNLDFVND